MKKQIVLTFIFLFLLTNCNKEKEREVSGNTGRVALLVNGNINVQTRAHDKTWDKKDAIGIYMTVAGEQVLVKDVKNRRYITWEGDGIFVTADAANTIYFPVDGSNVDFYAYYPYQAGLVNGNLPLDVSIQNNLAAIDLMVTKVLSSSTTPLNKQHSDVSFGFIHYLSKLELEIMPGKGISSDDLKQLKVEITGQRTSGSYNLLSGIFEVIATGGQSILLNTLDNGTSAQAILLPTTGIGGSNAVIQGRKLVFTLASNEAFEWMIPDDKDFGSGEKNLYKITINRNSLNVSSSIADWTEGNGIDGEAGSAE